MVLYNIRLWVGWSRDTIEYDVGAGEEQPKSRKQGRGRAGRLAPVGVLAVGRGRLGPVVRREARYVRAPLVAGARSAVERVQEVEVRRSGGSSLRSEGGVRNRELWSQVLSYLLSSWASSALPCQLLVHPRELHQLL